MKRPRVRRPRPRLRRIRSTAEFTDITFADASTGATRVAKDTLDAGDLGGFITAIPNVLAQAWRTAVLCFTTGGELYEV